MSHVLTWIAANRNGKYLDKSGCRCQVVVLELPACTAWEWPSHTVWWGSGAASQRRPDKREGQRDRL